MKIGDLVTLKHDALKGTPLDQIGIVVSFKPSGNPLVMFPKDGVITEVIGNCLETVSVNMESR